MKIKNLTPHAIIIHMKDNKRIEIPASGKVARCNSTSAIVGEWEGIPLALTKFGEVTDLPEQEDGVILIVSALVRQALRHRGDLASPSDLVRDEQGNIIGCKALDVNIFNF